MTSNFEGEIQSKLKFTPDQLMEEIGRSIATAADAQPPTAEVAIARCKNWFEDHAAELRKRLCSPEFNSILETTDKTRGQLGLAIAGAIATACGDVGIVLVTAYIIKLGIENFCKECSDV